MVTCAPPPAPPTSLHQSLEKTEGRGRALRLTSAAQRGACRWQHGRKRTAKAAPLHGSLSVPDRGSHRTRGLKCISHPPILAAKCRIYCTV
ncbi:hypothetical protein AGOR_G00240650 [Albula goreensis]|uniref:Uncharacterized protein n=1 Tax=Albula goreensis TaxID=1534307 RepID=A0A8T3CIU5_9TELE|nr:hypothetical protein AGOR_G00240650 [Albula goreensis]